MEIKCPPQAIVNPEILVRDDCTGYMMPDPDFRALVEQQKRVRFLSPNEMEDWNRCVGNKPERTAAAAFITYVRYVAHARKKLLVALDIVVDEQMFHIDGEDFTDIIPYSIEHELYEAQLLILHNMEEPVRDALATHRQYIKAALDGKATRVFDFFSRWAMRHMRLPSPAHLSGLHNARLLMESLRRTDVPSHMEPRLSGLGPASSVTRTG